MSPEQKVNSEGEHPHGEADEPVETRPRWWIRHPEAGVLATALLGLATFWVTRSIAPPGPAPGSTLPYLIVLPIALLLPAIAAGGAFIAWCSYRASHRRLMLAVPVIVAVALNAMAVALFIRWLVKLF